jgi:predicted transcriptional regulator
MTTTADTTTVRLPRELVEQVRELAVEHDRSLSAELRQALRRYIDTERGPS